MQIIVGKAGDKREWNKQFEGEFEQNRVIFRAKTERRRLKFKPALRSFYNHLNFFKNKLDLW